MLETKNSAAFVAKTNSLLALSISQAVNNPQRIPTNKHRRYYVLTVTTDVELGGGVGMGFGLSRGAAWLERGRPLGCFTGCLGMSFRL